MSDHPFLTDAFDVPWSQLMPERVEPDIREGLRLAQERIEAIAAIDPAAATFENVVIALESAQQDFGRAWGYVDHLTSVEDSPALREAHEKMLPKVTEFSTRIFLNEALWERVKAVAESEASKALEGADARLLYETVKDFRENGADLSAEDKARFEAINQELARLTQKFQNNDLDATNAFELIVDDENRLSGLPESAKEAAHEDALAKGHGSEGDPKWRFTLHAPSLLPVLKYADDEALRKEIWLAANNVASEGKTDNAPLIPKILQLRQEKAELLGYEHFADLVTNDRMAKSGGRALAFVEDLHSKVESPFAEENRALEQFKAEQTGTAPALLEPWEAAYWIEKQRRARYDFDEEEMRPYFSVSRVIDGMFSITEKLYGVTIRKRPSVWRAPDGNEQLNDADAPGKPAEVWHKEVRCYDLLDADGTQLGSFYADWHPRESKRSGAWMNPMRTGGPAADGSFRRHLGLIAGNITKPGKNKPALLTHDEVLTIFHEFGHLLHHMLGRVPHRSLNGTNVVWDWVELPSQIFENWCWEREALDLFARHYQTNAPLPEELLQKLKAARNYFEANATMRQLSFAKMDLELHLHPANFSDPTKLDEQINALLADYTPRRNTQPRPIIRRFGHLFSGPTGYAAGYYSYKWAEVLEADAFTRFQNEGLLNAETGRAFRATILEKGNSCRPEELFRDFMGRDPDAQALLKRAGLAS